MGQLGSWRKCGRIEARALHLLRATCVGNLAPLNYLVSPFFQEKKKRKRQDKFLVLMATCGHCMMKSQKLGLEVESMGF